MDNFRQLVSQYLTLLEIVVKNTILCAPGVFFNTSINFSNGHKYFDLYSVCGAFWDTVRLLLLVSKNAPVPIFVAICLRFFYLEQKIEMKNLTSRIIDFCIKINLANSWYFKAIRNISFHCVPLVMDQPVYSQENTIS